MQIRVAVENNMEGKSIAWVLDYPGCFANGSEETEALIRVPQALIAFKGWLDGCTEASWLKDLADFDIRLVETFRSYNVDENMQPDESGELEIDAWFHDDWRPVTEMDVQRCLQVVGWAHNDLKEMTASLSDEQLDRLHPGQRWPIRGILKHVATAEWWYLSRLDLETCTHNDLPANELERLQYTLDNLSAALPGTVGKANVRGVSGEFWSPRKIIRRACWHALDHCQHIYGLISQL
jgi:hypothetical protein